MRILSKEDEKEGTMSDEAQKGCQRGKEGHRHRRARCQESGHPGGSLGAADIMTYLYFEEMNVDPAIPQGRSRSLCAFQGHCAPGLYAVLAERGVLPQEDLETLRHIGSHLQGHPNMNDTPGVDMSTGSLGQGISPPPWAWPLPPSTGAMLTARTPCWAMAGSEEGPGLGGRHVCRQPAAR